MGGKVLVPTRNRDRALTAARLAADVCDVPTIILARTDANGAALLTSDVDERDHAISHRRTNRGRISSVRAGIDQAIARGLSYAPFADMIWCETAEPNLAEAKKFAESVHAKFPGQTAGLQLLAVVQLEEETGQRHDRKVPARTRRDGLQISIRYPGRISRAELQHVQSRAGLSRSRHGGIFRIAGSRVRCRAVRLHRDQTSTRGRHRLFR